MKQIEFVFWICSPTVSICGFATLLHNVFFVLCIYNPPNSIFDDKIEFGNALKQKRHIPNTNAKLLKTN
jgi:hypothetical protein